VYYYPGRYNSTGTTLSKGQPARHGTTTHRVGTLCHEQLVSDEFHQTSLVAADADAVPAPELVVQFGVAGIDA
jgi:hypothetical protein